MIQKRLKILDVLPQATEGAEKGPRREGRESELGADSASGWGAEGVSAPRCGACITALEARADKAQDDFVMKKPSDHRTHIHTGPCRVLWKTLHPKRSVTTTGYHQWVLSPWSRERLHAAPPPPQKITSYYLKCPFLS